MQEPRAEAPSKVGLVPGPDDPGLLSPQMKIELEAAAAAAGPSASSSSSSGPSVSEVHPVPGLAPPKEAPSPTQEQQAADKPIGTTPGQEVHADKAFSGGKPTEEGSKGDGKDGDKKKEEKEKPIPSGIKPRGLILPVLAVMVMAVPIIAICLPVFLTSRRQIEQAAAASTSMCALFLFNETTTNTAALERYRAQNQRECPGVLTQIEDENILYTDPRIMQPNNFPINVPPNQPDLEKYIALVTMKVTTMEATAGTAQLNADLNFAGLWTDARGRLQLGADYSQLNFIYYTATGGDRTLKTGDRSASNSLRTRAFPQRSSFNYPFDQYNITVDMAAHVVLANSSLTEAVPVVVKFETGLVGWDISVRPSLYIGALYIDEESSETFLQWSVIVERSRHVKFFAVLVLLLMWIITSVAVNYGLDLMYWRPRNATFFDALLFTSLMFALSGIRNTLPNAPPVGVGVDFYGFIWLILFAMLGGSQMYCKLVAQYTYAPPTLYDKVAKTEAYTKWMEKEAKEKAEKEKAEKEKAEKEKAGTGVEESKKDR